MINPSFLWPAKLLQEVPEKLVPIAWQRIQEERGIDSEAWDPNLGNGAPAVAELADVEQSARAGLVGQRHIYQSRLSDDMASHWTPHVGDVGCPGCGDVACLPRGNNAIVAHIAHTGAAVAHGSCAHGSCAPDILNSAMEGNILDLS